MLMPTTCDGSGTACLMSWTVGREGWLVTRIHNEVYDPLKDVASLVYRGCSEASGV